MVIEGAFVIREERLAPIPRALVVDKYVDTAVTLAMLIRLLGCEAKATHKGGVALALMESFQPSILLLDLSIPSVAGQEIARRRREVPHLNSVRLMVSTGWRWDGEDDRRRSREAGFDLHLTKPFERDAVVSLLAQLQGCP